MPVSRQIKGYNVEQLQKFDDTKEAVNRRVAVMLFNYTFNNISVISWRSFLLVEETEYSEKTTEGPVTL
jgi:hypothetical protein